VLADGEAAHRTWAEIVDMARDLPQRTGREAPPEGGPGEQAPGAAAPAPEVEAVEPEAPGGFVPLILTNGFASLADNNTSIPPDTMGAVGPDHLVTMLNSQIWIQDKAGNVVSAAVGLDAFWTAGVGPVNPFDPRVAYDRIHGRWYLSANRDSSSATAGIVFAASDTPDPTGGWTFYTFDLDATDTNWADFVSMGFNATWVVLTTDAIRISDGAYMGEHMWVLDATTLGGPLTVTQFAPGFDAFAPGDDTPRTRRSGSSTTCGSTWGRSTSGSRGSPAPEPRPSGRSGRATSSSAAGSSPSPRTSSTPGPA
jgi:hypothetical protein